MKNNFHILVPITIMLVGCSAEQPTNNEPADPVPTMEEITTPCSEAKSTEIVTAVVTNIPLEGGFFGLVSKDNQKFLPLNLDADFRKEGATLRLIYEEVTDQQSIYQWGTMIRIKDVCSADIPKQEKQPDSPEL